MLRPVAVAFTFALALVVLAPVAHADKTVARPSTIHYPTLEKLLRKFSRQAGDASRGKVYAQR
jgi:hypothetical protein